MIQSTISLGMAQLQAGGSFTSSGLQAESQANAALIAAGNAQVQQDTNYHQALSAAFSAIGSSFGGMKKT
jgi:hypothetical protein